MTCTESHKKAARKYYEKNRETILEKNRKYYEANRDKIALRHCRNYDAKKLAKMNIPTSINDSRLNVASS